MDLGRAMQTTSVLSTNVTIFTCFGAQGMRVMFTQYREGFTGSLFDIMREGGRFSTPDLEYLRISLKDEGIVPSVAVLGPGESGLRVYSTLRSIPPGDLLVSFPIMMDDLVVAMGLPARDVLATGSKLTMKR